MGGLTDSFLLLLLSLFFCGKLRLSEIDWFFFFIIIFIFLWEVKIDWDWL